MAKLHDPYHSLTRLEPLQDIKHAAEQFCLTYDQALWNYKQPDAVEADLQTLEDAIAAYRQAHADGHREGP